MLLCLASCLATTVSQVDERMSRQAGGQVGLMSKTISMHASSVAQLSPKFTKNISIILSH